MWLERCGSFQSMWCSCPAVAGYQDGGRSRGMGWLLESGTIFQWKPARKLDLTLRNNLRNKGTPLGPPEGRPTLDFWSVGIEDVKYVLFKLGRPWWFAIAVMEHFSFQKTAILQIVLHCKAFGELHKHVPSNHFIDGRVSYMNRQILWFVVEWHCSSWWRT